MIECSHFYNELKNNGINFFCGVPDSLLKSFCAYLSDNEKEENNIITANEGSAAAMASGWYLGKGEPALVYMQNSGLGNAVNPLASLIDPDVYSIPLLLLIGWRGEPGIKDEPQHKKQGKITLGLLEAMDIPYEIIDADTENIDKVIERAVSFIKKEKRAFALVARKNTFSGYVKKSSRSDSDLMAREDAIIKILENIGDSPVISTTGMISRELYEYREREGLSHKTDFLTVGSMGHCSQIAFGAALAKRDKKVFCFDGDGSVIMHMGNLALNGVKAPENLLHIVFNNAAHDSVGGQDTVGRDINLTAIAQSCGYKKTVSLNTESEIESFFADLNKISGPVFAETSVKKGARKDLGRPKHTSFEMKDDFMDFLKQD